MPGRWNGMLMAAVVMFAIGTPPGFEPAHHRNPPQVPNHDAANDTCPPRQDCPQEKPLRIVFIIPKTFPFATDLEKFGKAMAGSKWLERFTAAYDIPGPADAHIITVTDMPDLNEGKKDVSDYRDYIFKKARAEGLEQAPHHQTFYVLYIPCDDNHKPRAGMDSFGCTSHHPAVDAGSGQDVLFEPGDSMAVVLGFNPKASASAFALENATVPSSHELAEAVTDTRPGLRFNLHTDDPAHPYLDSGSNAGGSPWVRESGTIELADMSEGSRWFESGTDGSGPFQYDRIYSNKASKAGGDPDVPESKSPFYNVSTDDDWMSVSTGGSVNIPVTAWSAADIGSWDVDANVSHWSGHKDDPPAASPCSLSTKHWSVHNGTKFDVHVDTSGSRQSTLWCVLHLKSSKTVNDGDEYHEWFVGVIVRPPAPPPTPTPSDLSCVCADGFKAGPAARAGTAACEHICRGHERH